MLTDKVIISTRQASSEDQIGNTLRELGAIVLAMPLIEIHPITLNEKILAEIAVGKYQWLVFTSRNGVKHFFNQYQQSHGASKPAFKTAVFGNRTAKALEGFGVIANIINQGNSAIDLYEKLKKVLESDDEVLLVLGNLAADNLRNRLDLIVSVDRLNVYQTEYTRVIDAEALQHIADNQYDLILFASPSGYRSFKHHAGELISRYRLKTACIGPTTEQVLLADGIKPVVVASPTGKEGLINGIKKYFASSTEEVITR